MARGNGRLWAPTRDYCNLSAFCCDWHLTVDALLKTVALHSFISSAGTLAAFQLLSTRQLLRRVPRQFASTCPIYRSPHSRPSSTAAPYACCSLYGNPPLIDINNTDFNLNTPTRFDWRTRASKRTRAGTSKGPWNRQKSSRRITPPHASLNPGETFYEETRAYEDRYVCARYLRVSRPYQPQLPSHAGSRARRG